MIRGLRKLAPAALAWLRRLYRDTMPPAGESDERWINRQW